ncbi:MAG: hypothetical protein SO360_01970 [Bifidobacterium tsurumiense]|uniref:hypothetical protein n=1 Tax=Bifidobacterium tsurumiense TaxID=356829 RepID=UPI002A81FED5|nr:hypothetical protein [Bifidobacterium tsurumiense]MDY4677620.1 hypothetical protein [Bifidobacterium tsurumiense]
MASLKNALPRLSPHMTYGQMRRIVDQEQSLTVESALLPNGMMGVFDSKSSTILIDRGMTYRQKRCTLIHELVHWTHLDDSCGGLAALKGERRARRETALWLIDPDAYAAAEAMYGGLPQCIANELDVTLAVVRDFQETLRDSGTWPLVNGN